MSFLKSKTYKILTIVELCVLGLIIALNLISSFAQLSKGLNIAFFAIILVGALYVITLSITSIVLLAKEKKQEKEREDE